MVLFLIQIKNVRQSPAATLSVAQQFGSDRSKSGRSCAFPNH